MLTALMLVLGSGLLMLRLGTVERFPRPLEREEEERLVQLWTQEGDTAARNTLIERNMRLVSHVMKKYYASPEEADDLISIGSIGLIKGVDSYRPEKGVRLSTYVSRCIENELLMYFRSRRKTAGNLSLTDCLDHDGEEGATLLDVLSVEDERLEQVGEEEQLQQLREAVDRLPEREAKAVRLRYGLTGRKPMTQQEVAGEMKLSRSYISRLEKRALEKLRRFFDE